MILEIIGYIGSFLVVISMLMSSIIKLRVINTIGSVISGIYAVICGALPLALMNLCLIIINVVNLVKLLGAKMPYELVEGSAGDSLVKYFLDYYRDDIKTFFPAFAGADAGVNSAFITCCQGTPIGLLLGIGRATPSTLWWITRRRRTGTARRGSTCTESSRKPGCIPCALPSP